MIQTLFGEGENLSALQMCCRAFVLFFYNVVIDTPGGYARLRTKICL